MTDPDFLAAFEAFLTENRWSSDRSPWSLADEWDALVGQAIRGYGLGSYDFENDLAVRDLLARALADERLSGFPQLKALEDRVEDADDRFRASVRSDVTINHQDRPWWHRAVLRRAGPEYVEDMLRLHGIQVDEVR